jgi:hypothetical protein
MVLLVSMMMNLNMSGSYDESTTLHETERSAPVGAAGCERGPLVRKSALGALAHPSPRSR